MSSRSVSTAANVEALRLRTFGGAGLYAANASEPLLGPGKPLALVVYLALTPGRRTSREFLLDLLWADLEPERARNALRQVLFHLRRLLGDDALPGSEELTLARPIDSDRDAFLRLIERGELDAALEQYGGEFLPAFGVPGGARFEQWADLERDRLRSAFLRSGELLVRRRLNESRFKEAQRIARRVRDDAPGSEPAWRLLLETTVAARDFVAAALEADALEQWAAGEEVILAPATTAALAQARGASPGPEERHDEGGLVADLTGREREFSEITGAWEQVRAGRARHLHLVAPAGIGKTRLLRDATARLRAAGATVVELRGAPGDRDVPYALAADFAMAMASLPGAAGLAPASASALIALNPALSSFLAGGPDTALGDEALRRRVHALADLASAVADEQPFVLAIDDLHWADESSFRVLEGLFARLRTSRVLCLTAARPERRPSAEGVTTLALAPLTPQQVASLVAALGVVPDEAGWSRDLLRGLHEATRGSPLLVLETLRLAMDDGVLALEGGEWRCLDEGRLASLLRAGEALRQRVRALPPAHAWLLALLATAGTPLSTEALAGAGEQERAVAAEFLGALERQGLVAHAGAGWVPAHDEIADAGRAAFDAAALARAERAVGELLIREAGAEPHHVLRGMRHLASAGDEAGVRRSFTRFARLSRERFDRRPFAHLAAEVLGVETSSPRAAALVRTLPVHWRFGLWSASRLRFAAAGAVLAVGVATAAWLTVGARAASLPRLVYVDSAGTTHVVRVNPGEWDGRNSPVGPVRGGSDLAAPARSFPEIPPAVSPDGRSVAWNVTSSDSTTIDIWLRTPAGTRRLTNRVRDDLAVAWLPDGSGLVGLSQRWTPREAGDYDVAVFDTATGEARQITTGRSHEILPYPSPDGTRIAFSREGEEAMPAICVVDVDGAGAPECRTIRGYLTGTIVGWAGPTDLVFSIEGQGARPLIRYDWRSGEWTTLLGPNVLHGRLSPDRRWIVASARREGMSQPRDWIIPVDRPANARHVDGSQVGLLRWWEGAPDVTGVVDRIEFTDSVATVLPGIGTRLAIRALAASGTEVPLYAAVRWSSSDTSVATVDSLGVVHPRALGTVTIEASLAGWRAARRLLEVRGEPVVTAIEERWDDGWRSRWLTFGDPAPSVVTGPEGIRAFWNRGDGVYQSIAALRQSFNARGGLGLEVRVSTPLTRTEWQRLRVGLVAGLDTLAWASANPLGAPPSVERSGNMCGIGYPLPFGREGRWLLGVSSVHAQTVDLRAAAPEAPAGDWWTLRLQIFPDGRCGVAVNGKVLVVTPDPIPLHEAFWVRLGDNSAGSQLLHGPLEVWTGVRMDVDWTAVPSTPAPGA